MWELEFACSPYSSKGPGFQAGAEGCCDVCEGGRFESEGVLVYEAKVEVPFFG